MGRRPCCSKEAGLNRGAWTALEDKILTHYITIHGEGKWRNLPKRAGLKRCGKSCRLRWLNYLRPDIKRGNISHDEEELIIRLHNLLGNRWSLIAGRLPGRTDNEIKNYWNTNIGKKIQRSESSCTTSRKLISNLSEKETLPIEDGKSFPKQANTTTNSCVVRTKATRCTKVVISQEPKTIFNSIHHHHHDSILYGESKESNYEQVLNCVHDQVPKLPLMDDHQNNNDYSDFMTAFNFETDHENFLSEFLNMDFWHFSYSLNNNGGDGNVDSGTSKQGQSSPKSEENQSQTPMFSEDTDHNLYGADLLSGSPVIDSGVLLDWLQD